MRGGTYLIIIIFAISANANNTSKQFKKCEEHQRGINCLNEKMEPICGWLFLNGFCLNYPCVLNFENGCSACSDSSVEKISEGKCPEGIDKIKLQIKFSRT